MQVNFVRPRTGRETSRTIAYQCEPVINQNGRPEAVSGRLRRSAVWGTSIWGTEGREFKSPQPDKQIPRLNRRFAVSGVSRRTAEVRSGRASLEMASRSVDERQDAAGEWAGGIEVLDDQAEAFDDPEAVFDVAGVVRTAVTQGHQALDHGLHGLDLIGS